MKPEKTQLDKIDEFLRKLSDDPIEGKRLRDFKDDTSKQTKFAVIVLKDDTPIYWVPISTVRTSHEAERLASIEDPRGDSYHAVVITDSIPPAFDLDLYPLT